VGWWDLEKTKFGLPIVVIYDEYSRELHLKDLLTLG
jgi:hypothetical protein